MSFTEFRNRRGWKNPSRSLSPTCDRSLTCYPPTPPGMGTPPPPLWAAHSQSLATFSCLTPKCPSGNFDDPSLLPRQGVKLHIEGSCPSPGSAAPAKPPPHPGVAQAPYQALGRGCAVPGKEGRKERKGAARVESSRTLNLVITGRSLQNLTG